MLFESVSPSVSQFGGKARAVGYTADESTISDTLILASAEDIYLYTESRRLIQECTHI